MIEKFTETELLMISADTGRRFEAFIKSPKLKMRELTSLSFQILKDMGRPNNMIQDLIMMETLRQLRQDELRVKSS